MIILHDIQTKLAELKELVDSRAFHPYLIKNINAPYIDEDKLLLLMSMLDQLNLSDKEIDAYISAAMLIQLALDTHDHVRISSFNENLKNQQLTVLAGDYYSGLYYKYLSGVDNILLIRELSRGVKEINENKIMVYEKYQTNDIDDLINSFRVIEGAIFEKLIGFFQITPWKDFSLNFLLVKRLMHEKNQFLKTGFSAGLNALINISFQNDQSRDASSKDKEKRILQVFDQMINQAIDLMEKGKVNLPHLNKLLKERTMCLIDEHQFRGKTFVEEG